MDGGGGARGVNPLKSVNAQPAPEGHSVVQGDAFGRKLHFIPRSKICTINRALRRQGHAGGQGDLHRRQDRPVVVDAHGNLGKGERTGRRLQADLLRAHKTAVPPLLPGALDGKHGINPALQVPGAGVRPQAADDRQHILQARALQRHHQVQLRGGLQVVHRTGKVQVRIRKGSIQAFHLHAFTSAHQPAAKAERPRHGIRRREFLPSMELRKVSFSLHGKIGQGSGEVDVGIHHAINLGIFAGDDGNPIIKQGAPGAQPGIDGAAQITSRRPGATGLDRTGGRNGEVRAHRAGGDLELHAPLRRD